MSLGISPVVEEKIIYQEKTSEVEELLKNLDVNNLTPMQALNLLGELKGKV
jgi:DNA mismatch repair protein MutS